ncbi:ABC transporter substrate-binding protein [Allomuricauda sp. NBRC 101325]|uniref:ABC transporter substrate-binding protein n=1 Tax=Allomuricauda sp. NBRC 101325 TaxID=1113758 RepID=UPI0024A4BCC7|nr:ABC transporter substrate-binding protein [Muricauda sp. NBRC 101325]GLU44421.1 ABC transporter substrate-binding protein [Muricauda sp. NBRC 101325]
MAIQQQLRAALAVLIIVFGFGCKEEKRPVVALSKESISQITYAKGFTINTYDNYTVIEVKSPWPGSEKTFTYALVPKEKLATITLPADAFDAIVATPVEKIVLTSTTHIAPVEALDELEAIVGFPNTDFISSPNARKLVNVGQIQDLGMNEKLNTEMTLVLNPELIVGFSISEDNKAYHVIKTAGIPVVYNGEWVEQTPLGKAEWIKFFAPFFQKEKLGDSIFASIEGNYKKATELAKNAKTQPTVLTGGLYKDVWYVAGGQSWMAQFLKDANADYLWRDNNETGSIGLSLEAVLEKGKAADFWFNPSAETTYEELGNINPHHKEFDAFVNKNVYSNAIEKGEKGGLIFYESAPQRPDIVLKDLVHILHPELLPDHQLQFIKPLQ